MRKRLTAALLCLCLLFTLFPATAFAEGEPDSGPPPAGSALCEHHPSHDAACGYTEGSAGSPCAFVCEVCNAHDSGDTATPSDAQPEECTCEKLCTEEEINEDCPVCGAGGANLSACEGLEAQPATPSNALPVTVLAAEKNTVYVGGVALTGSSDSIVYAITNKSGEVITKDATADNYNIMWDGSTLTLCGATIKKELNDYDESLFYITGAAIGVFNQSGDANLTITLEGTNTIEGVSYGIRVYAPSIGSANLTITGSGTLYVNSNQDPIYVISSNGNAALGIKNAKVTATSSFSFGVTVQSGSSETSSASLTVDGGSLTATADSRNVSGIRLRLGTSGTSDDTPTVTVSNNAIVRANGSAGGITSNSSTGVQYGTGGEETGGIIWNGAEGTVYGEVELQEDLEIGEGESLTLYNGASLNTGDYTLTVDGGTLTGDVTGTVIYKVTSVSLNKDSLTLDVGGTATLTATITPSNATNQNVTWSSDNESVATVDTNGKVTATGTGTTTIKATVDGKSAQCSVTVNAAANVPVTSVSLNKTTLELTEGDTETLTATVAPSDATNQNVTWESSDTSVATVDATGKVTAVAPGTATITVTTVDGGKTATCAVTVNPVQYTVTVQTDGNGSASASPASAPAETTVTLTADPDSGYHFDGWEVVSGNIAIQNNAFTMPAGNVTVKAVFDRNSSGGGYVPTHPKPVESEEPETPVLNGWVREDGVWYLYQNGSLATGWNRYNGTWYYLDSNGRMLTGWQAIGGVWYCLHDWGGMATGWLNLNGTWYYLRDWGGMATGWLNLNGTWYYLYDWGGMAADTTTPDGYRVGPSGAWIQ